MNDGPQQEFPQPVPRPRRPLVHLALAWVAGTFIGFLPTIAVVPLAIVALLVLGLVLAVGGWRQSRWCLAALVALLVSWAVGWRAAFQPPTASGLALGGHVCSDPALLPSRDPRTGAAVFSFRVTSWHPRGMEGVHSSAWWTIRVYWSGWDVEHPPQYGDFLRIRCPEEFNERWPAREEGGRGPRRLSVSVHGDDVERRGTSAHKSALLARCYDLRRGCARLLGVGLEDFPETRSFLQAVLLGYREAVPGDLRRLFADTGTLHILAVSGLHVGVIAGIVVILLRSLGIPRTRWAFFVIPVLVVYTLATGARASAVRACLMSSIFLLAPVVHRRADTLSAIALSAILILAVDPTQLFDRGFIYSFVVVTGLVLLYPLFYRLLAGRLREDPLRLQPEPRWTRHARKAGRYAASLGALSISAWLSSAPLTALFFGRFVPVSVLSNLVVVPLSFLVVVSGCLSIVFGSCAAFLAGIFNHASHALVSLLVVVMRGFAAIPFGSMDISIPFWLAVAWYLALAAAGWWAGRYSRLAAPAERMVE